MSSRRWLQLAPLICIGLPVFAQYDAPLPVEERGKPFTITAQVRQEYDDNVYTQENNREESWKSQLIPTFIFNLPLDRTLISARYTFGLTYFWDRPGDDIDFSHEFVGRVAHTFTERFDIDVRDRFVYTYEPDLRSPGSTRFVDGNYLINYFSVFSRFQWLPRFGNTLEYNNRIVDYDSGYISTFEDRMEHTINLENRWQVLPTTVGVLGYRFNLVEYEQLPKSSHSHFLMGGVDHKINDLWVVSGRAGAEFRTFDEGDDSVAPYVSLSSTYAYAPNSTVSLFYQHSLSLTDVGLYTVQTSDTIGFNLYHSFTPDFGFKLASAFSWGDYDAGNSIDQYDDDIDALYGDIEAQDFGEFSMYLDAGFVYNFNEHLSAELGYIFSHLDSELPGRDYDRNRYYIGLRGTY